MWVMQGHAGTCTPLGGNEPMATSGFIWSSAKAIQGTWGIVKSWFLSGHTNHTSQSAKAIRLSELFCNLHVILHLITSHHNSFSISKTCISSASLSQFIFSSSRIQDQKTVPFLHFIHQYQSSSCRWKTQELPLQSSSEFYHFSAQWPIHPCRNKHNANAQASNADKVQL